MIDEKCEMLIRDFASWSGTSVAPGSSRSRPERRAEHPDARHGRARVLAAIDIPSSNVYISKNDDNYMELPRRTRQRQWMSGAAREESFRRRLDGPRFGVACATPALWTGLHCACEVDVRVYGLESPRRT